MKYVYSSGARPLLFRVLCEHLAFLKFIHADVAVTLAIDISSVRSAAQVAEVVTTVAFDMVTALTNL